MRIPLNALSLSFSLAYVYACADEHEHSHEHAKRAVPSVPLTPPTRPLEWGDLNIIHTTDSHGWLLGHQKASFPEPNYSGDFGDFSSFVKHMKDIALKRDVDLLLVDSGDLHDGTGITDGFPAGGIDAHDANQFIKQLPYDVMAIGNHELYIYENTLDMHQNFAPALNGRYLSSNVNIALADQNNKTIDVPVGNQFVKFNTRKGRSITAFGVLYDFTGNDVNTTVQPVADMVQEEWFLDAIQSEPDLFLLVGHMPVARDNWPLVFNAVRAVHPTTPIIILGGHTHIRDCLQLDGRSMSLESGRYMETVGWMSANLGEKSSSSNLTFSRRYLDPNRVTYEYHTRESNSTFDTAKGQAITAGLQALAQKFDLSFIFGTAPQDYTLTRAPYPGNDSLLSLFIEQATPIATAVNNTRADIPNLIIANSGALRFDLFSGEFNRNDQFTSSPFLDSFLYIPDVPLSVASQVLPALNNAGADGRRRRRSIEERLYGRGDVEMRYIEWLREMDMKHSGVERRAQGNLTLGYVTSDACPGVGDDTLHAPLPFFDIPDYIASIPPAVSDDTGIDLVFVDFFEDQLLEIVNGVQTTTNYTTADVQQYSPLLANDILGVFAQQEWN